MITCKEDLINTYIENDQGELRDLYLEKCDEFGIKTDKSRLYHAKSQTVGALDRDFEVWGNLHPRTIDKCRKLTLSDLKPTKQYAVLHKGGSYSFQSDKPIGNDVVACFDLAHSEKPLSEDFFDEKPRTKVGYEKVTESIFDLKDEFERGELYSDKDGKFKVEELAHLGACCQTGLIYRKVERPVEWWEDAVEFANNCEDMTSEYNKDSDSIYLYGTFSRDESCDFARILLEQEDENKNNASS